MRLIIQRVKLAKVTVGKEIVGEINKGLFVLLGIKKGDTKDLIVPLVEKLVNLRIMADEQEKMNLSIHDAKGEILIVSQFTLYANTSQGRRPSFLDAAEPDLANSLYEKFIEELRAKGIKVATGKFGAYMDIEAKLDGPTTIILEN